MRILGIVPARAGSRRIRGKNLVRIDGRPLLDWTLEAASRAKTLDRVVVSSDDPGCLRLAARRLPSRQAGGIDAIQRPRRLATDRASSAAVALHVLDRLVGEGERFDVVVLLQPTSPFRTAADIDAAVRLFRKRRRGSVVSMARLPKPIGWIHRLNRGRLVPIVQKAAAGPGYVPNGAVYVVGVADLHRLRSFYVDPVRLYEMPAERSLDIDTPEDLARARSRIRRRR